MMENLQNLLPYIVSVITAITGWFVGRKKQNNTFLQELQESVNMLCERNKTLLDELINVRGENATLLVNQAEMKAEIESLRKQNENLRKEIEHLNQLLTNVKTITRKG